MRKNRETEERPSGNEAAPDELGDDPREGGPENAGQSRDLQRLSITEHADNESVEELENADQAIEAAMVEGLEERRLILTINMDDLPPARVSDRKKAS